MARYAGVLATLLLLLFFFKFGGQGSLDAAAVANVATSCCLSEGRHSEIDDYPPTF